MLQGIPHTLWLLELASFSLQDFLCITFVVGTFVRHVHVDLFSLLLCAFLHADTCAVHICFVDESLLFLQHLELHNFFCIKQYSQTSWCLMGYSQHCYRLANMAGYYILQIEKWRHSIFINYAKKCTFFRLYAGCRSLSNHILVFYLNNHKIYL